MSPQTKQEEDGDWLGLATQLNVPKTTAYRWIREEVKDDGRGWSYNQKITAEHKEAMCSFIENNLRITLAQIVEKLHLMYALTISKPTVFRHLDMLVYTLKSVRYEPERANIPENKQKRKVFVQTLLNYQGQNLPILFMNETNFNVHVSRSKDRSVRGTRYTVAAAGSKGASIHMIGCISTLGLIHHEVRRGAFHREDACEWLCACFRKAFERYRRPVVIVIDNAPCHSRIEEILAEEEFSRNIILRLAPYSPMLNSIDHEWSTIKANVKSNLAENANQMLNDDARGQLSVKEYRLRFLERFIGAAIRLIDPAFCSSNIAHIQRKLTSALAEEDMKF